MMEVVQEGKRSSWRDFQDHQGFPYLILAAFFTIAALARSLRIGPLESDEVQQILHYLTLRWGYGSQPPLYEWLQAAVFQITGPSVIGLSVLKYGLLFVSTVLMAAVVRGETSDRSAVFLASFSLLSMPTVFLMSQRDLTHTVLAISCVPLFFWFLFSALKNPTTSRYLLVGAAIGLGAISKYNFVVIPAAAVLVLVAMKEFRDRVLDWKIAATLGAAAVIALPHALWLVQNLDGASAQTLNEMQIKQDVSGLWMLATTTSSFLIAALKAALPILAFFAVLFARDARAIARASNSSTWLVGWTFVVSLFLVYLTVLGIGATAVRQKWLAIYFVVLPLYLTLKICAAGIDVRPRLRVAVLLSGVLFVGVSAMLVVSDLLAPILGRTSRMDVPYTRIASKLETELGAPPAVIVTPSPSLAAHLMLQFPKAKMILADSASVAPVEAPAVFVTVSAAGKQDLPGAGVAPSAVPLRSIEILGGPSATPTHVLHYSRLTD
jgi:4-amino-4-deoxy-L-arabinose transferase-like glycosyltransferase